MNRLEKVLQNDDSAYVYFAKIIKTFIIMSSFYLFSILEKNSIYEILNIEIYISSKYFLFSILLSTIYFFITIFVFLSMTAYFMQELILEPYAGIVFQYTPSETTSLSGMQNGGVFIGMLTVGILATALKLGTLKSWVQAGCFGSCFMLISIMLLGQFNSSFPLEFAVIGLGFFNGMFAVAAIGSMMSLAGSGSKSREGTRMGLWGAAQAIAAGFGGLLGTILVDLLQVANLSPVNAYGMVFSLEAGLFALAALLASTSITFNKNYGKNIAIPGE